jgi:alpha-L-rhamnosidase
VTLEILNLRTEYRINPLGIDVRRPRLSWVLESGERGQEQRAHQILVATQPDVLTEEGADLWNSGRVDIDETAQIVYAGTALASRQRAWWTVRVWDRDDRPSEWSEAAFWELGPLALTDWRAEWVSHPTLAPDADLPWADELDGLVPSPLFRRSFTVRDGVDRARLYATAHGVYEPRLNGERVGDQVLAPGWTDYNKRVQYQTYDVTGMIQAGENVLGAIAGTGWYAGYVGWGNYCRHYGATPQVLMELHVDYADGTTEVIATDQEWTCATGEIRYADLLHGEYVDARQTRSGWDRMGYDAGEWLPVQRARLNATPLVADVAEPVRAQEEIVPVAMSSPEPGVHIFDLGQNIAGWARLRASGPAGTTVTLRFAEILNPNGTLYITNLRAARATDTFILSGSGEEVFEPRFTWHGFRYVEVAGLPGEPTPGTITGRFVGSDTVPAGDIITSDELINQLQRNIVWGQRGNFLSVPTDCPQRDERLGWMGDAQVFVGTAVGNMDVAAFFTKWMRDVSDAQSPRGAFPDVAPRLVDLEDGAPAWGDCGVIVPWTIWRTYGDTRIVDEHWEAMERWLRWLHDANPDLIWRHNRRNDFGDWLSIGADTPKELIGTAYFAYDARLMAEMAEGTGRDEAARRYRSLFEDIASAFRDAYVDEEVRIAGETQTVYCLALHFGLLTDEQRPAAAAHLVQTVADKNGHLSTGFVGVSYLCHVLTEAGYADIAYDLLHQETFPSWKYSILHGATTIWERWDGWTEDKGFQDPGMNSFNHYSLGSVGEWMRRSMAGIDQDPRVPGHGRARIRPQVTDSLSFVDGHYDSIRGRIRSRWERLDDRLVLLVGIPANVTAEVVLPATAASEVREGGVALQDAPGVEVVSRDDARTVVRVGSGTYRFEVAGGG